MNFFVRLLTYFLLMLVVSLEKMYIRQQQIADKNTTQNTIQDITSIENKTENLIVKLAQTQPKESNATPINSEDKTFIDNVYRNHSMQMPLDYEEDLNIHLRSCKEQKKCKKACKSVMKKPPNRAPANKNLTNEVVKENETGVLQLAQPVTKGENKVTNGTKTNGTQIKSEHETFIDIVEHDQNMKMPLDYEEDLNIHLRGCKEVKKCKRACKSVMDEVCEEYNCKKLKKLFKRACTDECSSEFSDSSGGEFYDEK